MGVLIWINGAFGAGKTHTAHELHRRLPGSLVGDPELIGFAMHKMLPPTSRDDFQDLPGWRTAVVATLRESVGLASGPVIVPMTIVRDDYFDEIIGTLRADIDVRHYALSASPATLRKRLRTRLDPWAIRQIDRCVTALATDRYATRLPTDHRSLDEVVEALADDAGLELTRPRLSPWRFQARRVSVAVRHIRL